MKLFNEGFLKSKWWIRAAMPFAYWRIEPQSPNVYLTFDDGPCPGITDKILCQLKQVDAKATFFCIGKQAQLHRALIQQIVAEGHAIGNHTFSHVNGWHAKTSDYVDDIRRGNHVLEDIVQQPIRLFRPPYGRMTWQVWRLIRSEFKCVMWDVTSQDFLDERTSQEIETNVVQNAIQGSIVLMHDSELAAPRTLVALPRILEAFQNRGMSCQKILLERN